MMKIYIIFMIILYATKRTFCSDAEFNVDTGNILKAIHERFPRSKRIYMTATQIEFLNIFLKKIIHTNKLFMEAELIIRMC